VHQQIMELLQINTLAMSYNIHFFVYNTNKNHVIQLISNVVWKVVYQGYLNVFKAMFAKETLRDHLCENLKELKTNNSNKECLRQITL
jgi:hypothetical protein